MAGATHRRERRSVLRQVALGGLLLVGSHLHASPSVTADATRRRWFEAAEAMKRLAQSWGDQPYGAVLVADGVVIGEGPSRVVKSGDPTAHAEREAIRDAQRRLGRTVLDGSVLYSTSRPCRQCEIAAAEAGVSRMIHGAALIDAGPPVP